MNRGERSNQLGLIELLFLGAAALIAALEGGLWLWTGAAGALFGSGWPQLSLDVLWHAIAGVAGHLTDPRQAFPARLRSGLPGPTGFYTTLLLLTVLLGVVAAPAVKLWQRARPSSPGGKRHGARWAGAGDLAPLWRTRRRSSRLAGRSSQPAGGSEPHAPARRIVRGLSLGYQGMRLLRAEDRHALVVFGPTQSGKSAGVAIPNILEWSGPAIVVSIKPDLLDATLTPRASRGELLVFDPFALWDQPSHSWSPLASARTWNGALETAQRMASAGEMDTATVKGGSFWSQAAEQRLAPLFYAAARMDRGMAEVVRWA